MSNSEQRAGGDTRQAGLVGTGGGAPIAGAIDWIGLIAEHAWADTGEGLAVGGETIDRGCDWHKHYSTRRGAAGPQTWAAAVCSRHNRRAGYGWL